MKKYEMTRQEPKVSDDADAKLLSASSVFLYYTIHL